jgi:hypothetical protein
MPPASSWRRDRYSAYGVMSDGAIRIGLGNLLGMLKAPRLTIS